MGFILLFLFVVFKVLEGVALVGIIGVIFNSLVLQILVGIGVAFEGFMVLSLSTRVYELRKKVAEFTSNHGW